MKSTTVASRTGAHAVSCATPSTAPPGLRERKKLETFRALQSAARRLVRERGLDDVTVDEIAGAADVSRRTFFNYFDTKEAAIVEREPGKVECLAAALAARPAEETPMQALRAAALATLAHHVHELQELTALICANPSLIGSQVAALAPFRRAIIEWAAARTNTDPNTDVYPALLAGVEDLMVRLTVGLWRPETGDEGFIDLANQIFDLLDGGLAAPRS
ncbi:TetR family transcriptional regulator [Planosporangium flavigriseum]|uniref:TetR family transcriptional regulator n=1 Tax=Planosporangium flavigriseum TaxID=373681 RepID=A0A8J3PNQ8_9ACTN|nr:TetR/AcrR family transcriptional regulator [Planosporangium flavigriseum]NJC68063.1 TetR family transcriptional regulator [Planosporangium flavigriseum]GIG76846.1 TetR family transcriptional regulator [Planosporangium flavigriseum]